MHKIVGRTAVSHQRRLLLFSRNGLRSFGYWHAPSSYLGAPCSTVPLLATASACRFSDTPPTITDDDQVVLAMSRRLKAELPSINQRPTRSAKSLIRHLSSQICQHYSILRESGKQGSVLTFLAQECAPSRPSIQSAIKEYEQACSSDEERIKSQRAQSSLYRACGPFYEELFDRLLESSTSEALAFLLALRADLLDVIARKQNADILEDQMKRLNAALLARLQIWFSSGMLYMQRITYETTAASIIEHIAKHEAVHPVQSLDDIRQRLGPDRRVYGLFPRLLPQQPLVVLHASLQSEIPASMNDITSKSCRMNARCATFYSISNLERGLTGVGLGEYLIHQAVQELQNELPEIETFATLSPMPNFVMWLKERVAAAKGSFAPTPELVSLERLDLLANALQCSNADALGKLLQIASKRGPSMLDEHGALLKSLLMPLAARYICLEKHRRKPLDPVARFHISNGAVVHRVNWAANLCRRGWQSSFGIMANYQYHLDDLTVNQTAFESTSTVKMDPSLHEWLQH